MAVKRPTHRPGFTNAHRRLQISWRQLQVSSRQFILTAATNILTTVTDILTTVTNILPAVTNIVTTVTNILTAVTDVLTAVTNILTEVTSILTAVTNIPLRGFLAAALPYLVCSSGNEVNDSNSGPSQQKHTCNNIIVTNLPTRYNDEELRKLLRKKLHQW